MTSYKITLRILMSVWQVISFFGQNKCDFFVNLGLIFTVLMHKQFLDRYAQVFLIFFILLAPPGALGVVAV